MHLSLIADLVRRKVWLAGIGMVIIAAVAQAAALATGPIALVQPIFIIELPVTLLLATLASQNRAMLHRLPWMAIIVTTVGLGAGLAIAQPTGPLTPRSARLGVALLSRRLPRRGPHRHNARRAAGRAARTGRGLWIRADRSAAEERHGGPQRRSDPVLHVLAHLRDRLGRVGSLLLQNALQAGSLVASQPMLTVGDALISISYGVTLFGEDLRVGWWLLPEIVALAAIVAGCIQIAKSPLASEAAPLVSQPAPTVQ